MLTKCKLRVLTRSSILNCRDGKRINGIFVLSYEQWHHSWVMEIVAIYLEKDGRD